MLLSPFHTKWKFQVAAQVGRPLPSISFWHVEQEVPGSRVFAVKGPRTDCVDAEWQLFKGFDGISWGYKERLVLETLCNLLRYKEIASVFR